MAKITKGQWEDFSEKAKWDIQVALRGPDSYYGETLKWFTTSVVRGHVRNVMRVGGSVNNDLQLVVLPDSWQPASTATKRSWNCTHFCEHIQQAASWMSIPIVTIPHVLWHKVMQDSSRKKAAAAILEQLSKQPYAKQEVVAELSRHLNVLKEGIY